MNKYIVEFIGAFFLILTIVCVVNGNPADNYLPPLAIGSILMVMIYAGGHISGAHYNPAVTLACTMRGACTWADAPMYMIAQVLGGAAAAALGSFLFGKYGTGATDLGATMANGAVNSSVLKGFVAELLGTFALAYVVLMTATTKSNSGNSHYGLAIGFTVLACAYALGGFGTGGCFNPAVAVGTLINGLNTGMNVGIIVVANLIAGALAALVFKATYHLDD